MTPARIRLLDSDVMIDLQHKFPAAVAWHNSVPPGTLALPGHTLMELYQDAQNTQQTIVIDRLTAPFPLVWPTDAESVKAVANFRRLHLQRQALPPHPRPRHGTTLPALAASSSHCRAHFTHIGLT